MTRAGAGLPSAFWWVWLGVLVTRAGTFVEPFFVLYLTGPRHLDARVGGVILMVWGAGSLLAQPIGGVLADRFGTRRTLGLTLATTAAALVALGQLRDVVLIAATSFVLGLVGDMARPATAATIANLVTEQRQRDRAYALQFWAINLGFSIASVSAGLLLRLGFPVLFVLDAATTLVFGLLAVRFVPDIRPESTLPRARLTDPVRLLRTDPRVAMLAAVMLVYATLYSQVYVLLPLSIRAAHLSASVFGYVVAVNGVLIVVLQPFTLRWTQRLPRRVTLPGAIAVIGLGVGMGPFCDRVGLFVLSVVLFTLGELGAAGAFQSLISALAPPAMRGRYAGTVGTAFGAAALIGPPLGATGFAFSAPFIGAACMVAGLIAAAVQFRLLDAITRRPEPLTAPKVRR